jgi:hypothetical protein
MVSCRLRVERAQLLFLMTALILTTPLSVYADGQFTFLAPGFTQKLYATGTPSAGRIFSGVAFAPNGDLVVVDGGDLTHGNRLFRFDAVNTMLVHGSLVHPQVAGSPFASDAGAGLTGRRFDTSLYSNRTAPDGFGVAQLRATPVANTGQVLSLFGSPANALGITADPRTNNVVYVGGTNCITTAPCIIYSTDPATLVTTTFATIAPLESTTIDGIAFEPTGAFLFLANKNPTGRLTILDRNGAVVQNVTIGNGIDGMAFHALAPKFLVSVNNDGSLTRFDFPNDDYARPPVVSVLASGGFRGDLAGVGVDGCIYATQNATRFDDLTTSTDHSVVKICSGFVPDPGAVCVNDGACDDDNVCTTDYCDAATCGGVAMGSCVHASIDCDDGDSCTADTCDPVLGCINTPSCPPPEDTGFVPPDTGTQKCEDKAAKLVSKLAKAISKCHITAADKAVKLISFDEEACEGTAKTKYDLKAAKLTGCPACLSSALSAIRDATESYLDQSNGSLYCAGSTPLP